MKLLNKHGWYSMLEERGEKMYLTDEQKRKLGNTSISLKVTLCRKSIKKILKIGKREKNFSQKR